MRRLRDRRQAGLFRGGELPRLMSMIVMLFVLAMMFRRASDRDTWRYFTGEPASADQAAAADRSSQPARAHPHHATRPAGSVLVESPEADAELAVSFEPNTVHNPASQSLDDPASQSLDDPAPQRPDDDSLAAVVSSAAASEQAEPNPEPAAETAAAASEPATGAPATEQQSSAAAKEESPAPVADREGESSTPAKEESPAPAEPATAEPAPAEPVAAEPEPRPAPLFRPHLPANPDTILQPGTIPAKPVIEAAPLDEDEAERRAFDYECEAISDRTPLGKEEMFAYWRLLRWAQSQSTEQLLKRARSGVRYGDLLDHPQDYRGELFREKLHIAQVRREDSEPDSPLGGQHYYQAIGWNDASQTWFYFCIFADLPEGMPIGDRTYEEGTFVGYFLKTFVYLDGRGVKTKAPILIGRMIYEPAPVLERNKDEWLWGCAVAGVLFVLFLARWGWRLRGKRDATPQIKGLLRRDGLPDAPGEGLAIDDWLARVESPGTETEIKSASSHDLNGSAAGDSLPLSRDHGLDWTEDRER